MDLSKYKILVITRSINHRLFKLSSSSIDLSFKHIRLKNTTADGYIYEILKRNIDFAINIDEDAFILDNKKLLSLLEYCITNNIINCGFPDGGVLPIRSHNPIVTNPFFNIINVREIRKKFTYQRINQFSLDDYDYTNIVPQKLLKSEYVYDFYEPYYPVLLWINLNFKTLYLDGETHSDGISTILKDMNGEPFLYHSWYSRFYGKEEIHTKRINNLYSECINSPIPNESLSESLRKKIDSLEHKYYFRLKVFIKKKLKKLNWIDYV